jgi:hypothetical protein
MIGPMNSMRSLVLVCACVSLPLASGIAQVTSIRGGSDSGSTLRNVPKDAPTLVLSAHQTQANFELYRRANLVDGPAGRSGGSCDEQVGRFCYWYDEKEPPAPPEPARVRDARDKLIVVFDSAAAQVPGDGWVAGQRVRYLAEANRTSDAVAAAKACKGESWWCASLVGFAHHVNGEYGKADSAYRVAIAAMPERERCAFGDVTLLLDDGLLPRYRQTRCGSPERAAFERRVWWLARPLFASAANDARTEYYARMTMVQMLTDAPSAHEMGFDADERELLLRYSWPRAWTKGAGRAENGGPSIVGHEPSPAYPYLPGSFVFDNPVASDSLKWTTAPGVVRARYQPAYAVRLRPLEHQSALFRRGDSSLVVMAYDVHADSALNSAPREAALVLTRGEPSDATIVRLPNAPTRGVLTAKSTWEPLLMSAEVVAPSVQRTARARYGTRPPYGVGARVTLSDILLFEPYGSLPAKVEDVIPHALPSLRVRADKKLGFFWEAYGTNPVGEPMSVSLTVAPEYKEPGFWQRRMQALRLSKDAKPVSVSLDDMSARGTTTSARAVDVDISTLKPGRYVVELEIEVAKQYRVRAERTIEVIP